MLHKSSGLVTHHPDGVVQLREMETTSEVPPLSVPTLLRQAAEVAPEATALAVKRDGQWIHWTYMQYYKVSIRR